MSLGAFFAPVSLTAFAVLGLVIADLEVEIEVCIAVSHWSSRPKRPDYRSPGFRARRHGGDCGNTRAIAPRQADAGQSSIGPVTESGVTAADLARGAEEVLPEGVLDERLGGGRSLRVKLGIDPTAPDIHLGHVVPLTKLRQFQDAGHTVVLIIGDYTARVGDPSGRDARRPVLSAETIDANAKTFQEQAFKVLDPGATEVRFNSEWLDMSAEDLFRLVGHTTVARLLERDDFTKRMRRTRRSRPSNCSIRSCRATTRWWANAWPSPCRAGTTTSPASAGRRRLQRQGARPGRPAAGRHHLPRSVRAPGDDRGGRHRPGRGLHGQPGGRRRRRRARPVP